MRFNLQALKANEFSINEKINFRANYDFFYNCLNLRMQLLEVTKVGTLLRPYEHTLLNFQSKQVAEIQKEKAFFGGKTRFEYENNI